MHEVAVPQIDAGVVTRVFVGRIRVEAHNVAALEVGRAGHHGIIAVKALSVRRQGQRQSIFSAFDISPPESRDSAVEAPESSAAAADSGARLVAAT